MATPAVSCSNPISEQENAPPTYRKGVGHDIGLPDWDDGVRNDLHKSVRAIVSHEKSTIAKLSCE